MIEVIYEDNNIFAINKPPGLIVYNEKNTKIKERCLSSLLLKEFPVLKGIGGERGGAVHRLDKDTSGVILFAKNNDTLLYLQKQILEKKAKKEYITLVYKNVKKNRGVISSFITRSPKDRRKQKAYYGEIGKRRAITFFKVLKRFEKYTLLKVRIKTGRKHQIRCHLSFIGHPVVGDRLYKFKDNKDPKGVERQLLHAKLIKIQTPAEKKCFKTKLPSDFKRILKSLS